MLNSQKFDEIARKLADLVPERVKGFSDDLQKNFRSVLQSSLTKMDLITREEFDAQTKVLAKTRSQLEIFEQRIAELEKHLLGSAQTGSLKSPSVPTAEVPDTTQPGDITRYS